MYTGGPGRDESQRPGLRRPSIRPIKDKISFCISKK
uniref:Uncharacterized protein n=1 Tax=Microviridae sp. ct13s5 TaxID=2826723 RepID=A0A8S5M6E9_9VIRU|nr:MAG TPA: hypothetical protein [Microviridae sp. ct13s5]